MATGFVDRFKGKTTFDAAALLVGGLPQYGPQSVQVISTTAANAFPGSSFVDGSTITPYGVTLLASSAAAVAVISPPRYAGQFKVIQISSIPATSIFIMTSTTQSGKVGINGSSMTVIKSTVGWSVLEFVATSTANWTFAGLNNSSATHTLSTTT